MEGQLYLSPIMFLRRGVNFIHIYLTSSPPNESNSLCANPYKFQYQRDIYVYLQTASNKSLNFFIHAEDISFMNSVFDSSGGHFQQFYWIVYLHKIFHP